ncbi:MAG: glycine dehydrogenase (aminomethyl-transferring) [Flavobacteriales bacterium]|nr:glycine dehydrogenase (aminomethyl-transferring) [Flavobacteriales bacterium]
MTSSPFSSRHIGLSEEDIKEALKTIGEDSIESLIAKTIPQSIRLKEPLKLEAPYSEYQYLNRIKEIAHKNQVFKSYIGLGYYNTKVPSVIQRNIFENPGWYTAYTPYQAEIAQGRLEALLNFQTMVTDLTAMDIANASLLDEATAVAEGMSMMLASRSREMKKAGVNKFFVASDCFPQTLDVLKTRSKPIGVELIIADPETYDFSDDFFGVFLQYPNVNGKVYDYSNFIEKAHEKGALVGVAADLMSLAMLKPPGEWGADVVCGTTQRFGIPMGFGGPHAAYFATRDAFKRNVPGRIIGLSVDADGKAALRMALQTREQHIKRDRATSNICTAQVLLAVMAGMYAVYHGKDGISRISRGIHAYTHQLHLAVESLGYEVKEDQYFDTLHIGLDGKADEIMEFARERMINFRKVDDNSICVSLNESVELHELNNLINLFADFKKKEISEVEKVTEESPLKQEVLRSSSFLTHPVFNRYQTETEMMRYIKRLENKDFSLVHGMIPLGSCTMKLNAATELMPLSWPEFGNIHPFAPKEQVSGYYEMINELERDLSEITGFHKVSLQPNSGAQGEYAGLMVIRAYHEHNGDEHRNIALIPSSAHGTNPASAVMAGMDVVVVKCDEAGNIDLEDLEQKANEHSENLAALMITYPSTHGVFEEDVVKITQIIHQHGGQVYMDGANMNAQVGLTNPANIGADVCHLNLHKTFAIPHGGGGPGMGPIGVAEHLAPFLPSNPIVKTGGDHAITSISAAPFGSSLVLIISHAYIKMLGEEGLRKSTETAILSANYIKKRLEGNYNILYQGKNNTVAHEMILDCRHFKQDIGIEVVDIAKRLIDYGFHAPTVSFPVNDTLMVEPTESESLVELDRFIDAMLKIREEIGEIESGESDRQNNVLKNAPHTELLITADEWNLPYSRKKAAYPLDSIMGNKFWAAVRRVDNAFGDRNLICSCPPISEYETADLG